MSDVCKRRPTDIVIDIETAPADEEAIELYNKYFAAVNKTKRKTARPGLHPCVTKIIVVGIKPLKKKPIVFAEDPGSGVGEKEVLEETKKCLEDLGAGRYITYNGTAFDFPMLRIRAAVWRIDGLGRLLPAAHSARNCDLYRMIKWDMPLSLSEMALVMTGAPKCVSGDEIAELYKNGQIEKIIEHNISDLELTEMLYLHKNDLFGTSVN